MSVSRLSIEAPELAAKLEQAAPHLVRELTYQACTSASTRVPTPSLVADALSRWYRWEDIGKCRDEIAALMESSDDEYFGLQDGGAEQPEWEKPFRIARACAAAIFAFEGSLLDAIYEAIHATKGIDDLAETLRTRLDTTG